MFRVSLWNGFLQIPGCVRIADLNGYFIDSVKILNGYYERFCNYVDNTSCYSVLE